MDRDAERPGAAEPRPSRVARLLRGARLRRALLDARGAARGLRGDRRGRAARGRLPDAQPAAPRPRPAPPRHRLVVRPSETLRRRLRRVPALIRVADSVVVRSRLDSAARVRHRRRAGAPRPTSPVLALAALAIKLEDGGAGALPAAPGRSARRGVRAAQAPHDGRRRRADGRGLRGRPRRHAHHARRPGPAAALDRRAAAALERRPRRDERDRPAADARATRSSATRPRQRERLEVKPGITGWAQIHGRAALPWEERIELDVWYVEHRSAWLDLKILVRTPFVLFRGTYKGATGGWGHG